MPDTPPTDGQNRLEVSNGIPEWHVTTPEAVVCTAANCAITIDKLYGPLAASEVRVRLEYTGDVSDWVVEYRNPSTEQWEEKARWSCQENWPRYDDE